MIVDRKLLTEYICFMVASATVLVVLVMDYPGPYSGLVLVGAPLSTLWALSFSLRVPLLRMLDARMAKRQGRSDTQAGAESADAETEAR